MTPEQELVREGIMNGSLCPGQCGLNTAPQRAWLLCQLVGCRSSKPALTFLSFYVFTPKTKKKEKKFPEGKKLKCTSSTRKLKVLHWQSCSTNPNLSEIWRAISSTDMTEHPVSCTVLQIYEIGRKRDFHFKNIFTWHRTSVLERIAIISVLQNNFLTQSEKMGSELLKKAKSTELQIAKSPQEFSLQRNTLLGCNMSECNKER